MTLSTRSIFQTNKLYLAFIVLLGLINIATLTYILSITQNTLKHNGQWITPKLDLTKSVMFSQNFLNDTQALYKNQLNLSVWAGHNEVLYKHPLHIKQYSFDFLLTQNAYLYVVLGKNDNTYYAVRISDNSLYPSALIKVSNDGEFLLKQFLSDFHAPVQVWTHFDLVLNQKTGTYDVYVNNQLITSVDESQISLGYFGLRGSSYNTHIDNVYMQSIDGSKFVDDFFNDYWSRFYLLSLIIVASVTILFLVSPITQRKFTVVGIHLTILLSLVIFALFDHYYFLGAYPNPRSMLSFLKKNEQDWVNSEAARVTQILTNQNNLLNSENKLHRKKVLMMGTSQTWGAGATGEEKTFVSQAVNALNTKTESLVSLSDHETRSLGVLGVTNLQDNDEPLEYVIMNAGISGSRLSLLVDNYEQRWVYFSPDVVIVNVGHNDEYFQTDEGVFEQDLQGLIDLNKQNSIQTILMIEADSPEERQSDNPLHEIMRVVGARNNVYVIDMYKYLFELKDTGIIWWDVVHPTDYGHQLIAGQVADVIRQQSK